jgi:hypothetical protein
MLPVAANAQIVLKASGRDQVAHKVGNMTSNSQAHGTIQRTLKRNRVESRGRASGQSVLK